MIQQNSSVLDKVRYISDRVRKTRGTELYQKMVVSIAEVIGCDFVFIASLDLQEQVSQTLAVSDHGKLADNFSYPLKDTPCEDVSQDNVCVYKQAICQCYPNDQLLVDMGIEAYVGAPLFDSKGNVEGIFVALHSQPIENDNEILLIFEIASVQAALEIERQRHEQQNYHLLHYDKNSGFLNKMALQKQLKQLGEKSLLQLSINNFYMLNEAYGMHEADKILVQIAQSIQKVVKADHYASLGISTYALLFSGQQDLQKYIHDLESYFSQNEVHTDSLSLYVSFSFGGAVGHTDLLRIASTALRKAKDSVSDSFYIFNEDAVLENFSVRQRFIETSNIVYEAIEKNLFVPYFQGIQNNKIAAISKYEALARIHYKGQVLTPYNFIEAAQLSGVLPKITRIMIKKSFAIMSHYNYEFSINISEDDLSKNYLLDFLLATCETYNILPERVTLEILEGISSSGKAGHLLQIKQLKKAGFKIAIDDFGAEYSNFERVLDLEVDYIKIDAKYIKHIDTDSKSYEVVKAITYFCENTGIETIAEFVSTPAIQEVVDSLGIAYSQGYLFSEPQPKQTLTPNGTFDIYLDKQVKNLIWIEVHGHYQLDMGIDKRIEKIINNNTSFDLFNVIFDARNSDFFQVSEEDIIEQANIDSTLEVYKKIKKCALINNDSYSKCMTQIWCDHLHGTMQGKLFSDEQTAKNWLNEG